MNSKTYFKQRGFTLMEAMVAMLIFSIGLLGLAGLQGTGMQQNHGAYLRTVAIQQAYDMSDRMRNNRPGVNAGNYLIALADTIPTDPDCITNVCNTAQIATFDIYEWTTNNAALLPGGRSRVISPAAGQFIITVMYDENRIGTVAATTGCNPATATDLTCVRIEVQQ